MKNKKKLITFILYSILILLSMYFIYINKEFLKNILIDLYDSFNRTLIEENRYILIFNGLKSTLIISTFSIIIGTILGLVLFLIRKSKIKMFKNISKILIGFLRGTPITVLLLICYYVAFGSINIDPIIVAIITFSIYFSAYVSEIFRSAYISINITQIHSAYSMGFNKIQTFRYIILPQILSCIIPVFKNECVSLIKSTSIAGYISIMDLTKASDIIRNRTYEPFFPLIFTAIIYFIICFIVSKVLDFIYLKINPRKVKKYE